MLITVLFLISFGEDIGEEEGDKGNKGDKGKGN